MAQLNESDLSPMIFGARASGTSFSKMPFLYPPGPLVTTRTKEQMFLRGILDNLGVTQMGQAVAARILSLLVP